MSNPNEFISEFREEDLPKEGTSWINPGEFPAFMSVTGSSESIDNLSPTVSKEARVEQIRLANKNMDKTLLTEYVQSDWFDRLSDKNLDITAIRPVQEQLCAIPEGSRELFLSVINTFDRKDNWKPRFQAVLNSFTSGKFDDLIRSVTENGPDGVDLAAFDRIITHKDNYLNISNIDELSNIEGIIDGKITEAAQNGDVKQWENFALLKKYNLSLDEAKILVEKYAYKIEDVEVDKNADTKQFLSELRSIVSAKTPEEFGGLLDSAGDISFLNYPDFQIEVQRMYAESFNRDLFNPRNHERRIEDGTQMIDAGTDFKMIVRSEGAFSSRRQDDNHAARWNQSSRPNAAFSTSLISNNHLLYYGMMDASEDAPSVTYGFSDLDEDAVLENALGDDATMHKRKATLDTSSYGDYKRIHPTTFDGCGQRFMTLDGIIDDSSRDVHTESVLSRFYLDKDGNEQRRQPSYIVYVKTGEDFREDPLYEESKKTARDFDIPVVMIDMRMVLAEERQKVEQSKAELEQSWTVDGVMNVVQSWANNSIIRLKSGAAELVDEFFPEKIDGNNMMAGFIAEQMEKAPSDTQQLLFDKLMVLNAKKRIVPETFLARLQHDFHLSANLDEYGQEILGVTVNDQSSDEVYYSYRRIDGCYDVCEEFGLTPTDKALTTLGPEEMRKSIELCIEYGLDISEDLALIWPRDLEQSIEACRSNGLQLDSSLLIQKSYILDRKITMCKNDGIPLSIDILKKTEQEISAIASENNKVTQSSDDFGLGDFSMDGLGDDSWNEW